MSWQRLNRRFSRDDELTYSWGMLACVVGIVTILGLLSTWACLELR